MPLRNVQTVIGKAVVDTEYRELLFSDPEEAIKDQNLTTEEIAGLKGLSRAKFNEVSAELEDQMLAQVAGGGPTASSSGLNPGQYETIENFDLGRLGATFCRP